MNYEEITQFDTELTADVVQWRPVDLAYQNTNQLACGTYFLNKELNERIGRVYLLELVDENHFEIINKHEFMNSGVLDLQWTNSKHFLTIDSKDVIELFKFDDNNSISSISKTNLSELEKDSVGLTFDYTRDNTSNEYGFTKILSSNSKGQLSIIESSENSIFEVTKQFHAHDYEIWSVKFDEHDFNLIYSGADDSLLKLWDLRTDSCIRKANVFNGGVCSIIQSHKNENQILCGSYDEQIYLLDKRNMKTYVHKSEKLGGGVWKMRVNPLNSLILCACMHKGAYLIDFDSLEQKLFYEKHRNDTVVYGCDWKKRTSNNQNKDIIATCAFYSHELRLWSVNYN